MIWFRTLLFVIFVPGVTLGYVPAQLIRRGAVEHVSLGAWRWLGILPLASGILLMLWCFGAFAVFGRGTPAPIDPPRSLVVQGAYRWVRNPMYVGAAAILLGETLLFEVPGLLWYGGAFALSCHLFVIGYEERALASRFGADYEAYRARVSRWIPRRPGRE